MEEKTQFFGYGALRDRKIIKEIIGHDPGIGRDATIHGYQLAYQVLDQVPETIRPTLEKIWGKDFKAYTLRRGEGSVAGIIWELAAEDLQKIQAWECKGSWREEAEGTAKLSDGTVVSVVLEKVPDNQPVKETVDGLNYETHLNLKAQKEQVEEQDNELLRQVRLQLGELRAQSAYGRQAFA